MFCILGVCVAGELGRLSVTYVVNNAQSCDGRVRSAMQRTRHGPAEEGVVQLLAVFMVSADVKQSANPNTPRYDNVSCCWVLHHWPHLTALGKETRQLAVPAQHRVLG